MSTQEQLLESALGTSEELTSQYRRVLADLLMDIEPMEGAEDGVPVEVAVRKAARLLLNLPATPEVTDIVLCLEHLAGRLEDVKDLQLHD